MDKPFKFRPGEMRLLMDDETKFTGCFKIIIDANLTITRSNSGIRIESTQGTGLIVRADGPYSVIAEAAQ